MRSTSATKARRREPVLHTDPGADATGLSVGSMHRFTLEQYHRMADEGFFDSGGRVELLEGWVVHKMTQNPPHPATIGLIQGELLKRIGAGWALRVQAAVTIPESESEPEPDIVLARGRHQDYFTRHPGPTDIGLIVEVSDTTLSRDRGIKARIYAQAKIALYWIVNLPEGQLEVYTRPVAGKSPRYREKQLLSRTDEVSFTLDGTAVGPIPVADLLPPAQIK